MPPSCWYRFARPFFYNSILVHPLMLSHSSRRRAPPFRPPCTPQSKTVTDSVCYNASDNPPSHQTVGMGHLGGRGGRVGLVLTIVLRVYFLGIWNAIMYSTSISMVWSHWEHPYIIGDVLKWDKSGWEEKKIARYAVTQFPPFEVIILGCLGKSKVLEMDLCVSTWICRKLITSWNIYI